MKRLHRDGGAAGAPLPCVLSSGPSRNGSGHPWVMSANLHQLLGGGVGGAGDAGVGAASCRFLSAAGVGTAQVPRPHHTCGPLTCDPGATQGVADGGLSEDRTGTRGHHLGKQVLTLAFT